jgi:hypothetical protein
MAQKFDLTEDVMARAAQDFFASEWASAREESGFRFRPGINVNDECPAQDREKLLELIRPYVARLAEAWGRRVGEMFRLMEIPESRWADALYYTLMSCRGHGVGLTDTFGSNIDIAEDKLSKGIDTSPFLSEFNDFGDLASEVVEAEAKRPDDDPGPDDPFQPGDRVRVEARMPTGDRFKGTGTVVRWLPVGNDLSTIEGVIVTMDDGEDVEPWSYRGRSCFVEEGDCEFLADGEAAAAE